MVSKNNIYLILFCQVTLSLNSCSNKANESFQCDEFWIDQNIEWRKALDDIKYSESRLLIKSEDSIWAILYPGTLVLKNDTIHINQEAGYPIICHKVGHIGKGDSTLVEGNGRKELFIFESDSLVTYADGQYIKNIKYRINNCPCEKWE